MTTDLGPTLPLIGISPPTFHLSVFSSPFSVLSSQFLLISLLCRSSALTFQFSVFSFQFSSALISPFCSLISKKLSTNLLYGRIFTNYYKGYLGVETMNKIFKVIYNRAKHCYVVASELAKSYSKGGGSRSIRRAMVTLGVAVSI